MYFRMHSRGQNSETVTSEKVIHIIYPQKKTNLLTFDTQNAYVLK